MTTTLPALIASLLPTLSPATSLLPDVPLSEYGWMGATIFVGACLQGVGGIGFAMLFLVIVSQKLVDKGLLSKPAEQGVGFWSAMYIPIVVAMSANQNVIAALKGGPVALIAGVGAVFIGFLLIKPLSKIGSKSTMTRSAD